VVYPYLHWHSNAWEGLWCFQGNAQVQLGGFEKGILIKIEPGDFVLLPPGVAHEQLSSEGEFSLLGTYPPGAPDVDLIRTEKPTPEQAETINNCPIPPKDPLFGDTAPWGRMSSLFC